MSATLGGPEMEEQNQILLCFSPPLHLSCLSVPWVNDWVQDKGHSSLGEVLCLNFFKMYISVENPLKTGKDSNFICQLLNGA